MFVSNWRQVIEDCYDRINHALKVTASVSISAGRSSIALVRNAYASTNVTTSAYIELIHALSSDVTEISIFDSSGQEMVLAVGASGSEVDKLYIPPGGHAIIDLKIASGSRVSLKAVSATASTGVFQATFLG